MNVSGQESLEYTSSCRSISIYIMYYMYQIFSGSLTLGTTDDDDCCVVE